MIACLNWLSACNWLIVLLRRSVTDWEKEGIEKQHKSRTAIFFILYKIELSKLKELNLMYGKYSK
jgi:hypothetical protein